jgi:predicted metal-dependent phosphoesterase TrpH
MLDLHIHTTASDGTCTPTQVVAMAKEKGFTLVAITDHDTMDGVAEAMEAGKRYNVEVVPGVEISSGISLEVHMLGYGMSPDHPAMVQMLEDMRQARVERMIRIIENLKELGIPITAQEVEALADGAIGRPHIARVLVAHGVVPDVRAAFRDYIGLGAKAYAERRKMTSEAVIRNIRAAGGVPVLAHGGLLRLTETELTAWIDSMCKAGLMGLECYHNAHTPEVERFLRRAAKERGLVVTGGSDFHGETRKDVDLGTGLERWDDRQACRGKFLKAVRDARRGRIGRETK